MIHTSDSDTSGGGFSFVSLFIGLVLITLIGFSFVPKMIKSVIVGYEWSSENLSMPFRIPLIRPVYLDRGDIVKIGYSSKIDNGRLDINAHYSPQLLTMLFQTSLSNITTLRADAEGIAEFKAPQAGFYLFNVRLSNSHSTNIACANPFSGLWDVLIGKYTNCANYKVRYYVTIRDF